MPQQQVVRGAFTASFRRLRHSGEGGLGVESGFESAVIVITLSLTPISWSVLQRFGDLAVKVRVRCEFSNVLELIRCVGKVALVQASCNVTTNAQWFFRCR